MKCLYSERKFIFLFENIYFDTHVMNSIFAILNFTTLPSAAFSLCAKWGLSPDIGGTF